MDALEKILLDWLQSDELQQEMTADLAQIEAVADYRTSMQEQIINK
ncbi:hypothetical protein JFQ92_003570 [Edwardsiella piscicida]|nr:hypothetical protein [Edwardsiella piscicida]UCQ29771.1 hypothetical protein DCF74_09690 [Edwardsiella piscicida]